MWTDFAKTFIYKFRKYRWPPFKNTSAGLLLLARNKSRRFFLITTIVVIIIIITIKYFYIMHYSWELNIMQTCTSCTSWALGPALQNTAGSQGPIITLADCRLKRHFKQKHVLSAWAIECVSVTLSRIYSYLILYIKMLNVIVQNHYSGWNEKHWAHEKYCQVMSLKFNCERSSQSALEIRNWRS